MAAQAWSSACVITSPGCAPEIPYRRSITKNGTPVAPSALRGLLVRRDLGAELIGVEHRRHLGRIKPDVGGQPGQGRAVEDRLLLGEVRAVQPLDQLGLEPALARQLQQPVRVPGAAAAQIAHPEGQAGLGGALLHLLLRGLRLLRAHPVLGGQPLGRRRRRVLGRGRVELERAVHDVHFVAMAELPECVLKVPFAQIAPWAHDVRPDLYLHADG